MDPVDVARRLIAFASEAELDEIEVEDFPVTDNEDELWLRIFGVHERYRRPAQIMIEELRGALAETDWDPDLSDIRPDDRDRWSFGEAIIFRGFERMILRGLLVPRRKVPILRRVPDDVALFLISIDDGEDYLTRESHGMGWHYHYQNWRKDRSNVILSWDTRWHEPSPQTEPPTQRALFVEPHGEKNNADFEAKPWLWREKKRKSMYDACSTDLVRWRIGEFKCAANKSEVVYPAGRVLTPHPAATATVVQKAAASAKTIRKRRR
ncbi:hypothetical protein EWE75_09965 [Sphingomonas populi]|uniref:Uncharacterized protein n=1 Tax=Sphingomonas populi TaxID=2484750 RepID=A0A4V2DDE5_9SPHN|nr:hypothetical protein [Sphingomonas populi]RZF64708.1 hypothetical protein EWE75_09965 [Sphingomonas populi]